MNYMDGMRCEVNHVETRGEEIPLRIRLEETQGLLLETREMLRVIIINMINAPKPDTEVPKACCLDEQALINCNLSCDCRDMAKRIIDLLVGEA